jgi:hypothetical protein
MKSFVILLSAGRLGYKKRNFFGIEPRLRVQNPFWPPWLRLPHNLKSMLTSGANISLLKANLLTVGVAYGQENQKGICLHLGSGNGHAAPL